MPARDSWDMRDTQSLRPGAIRVLLIENVNGSSESFRQELERAQFDVRTRQARSARELARRCLEQPYGAIVCDVTTGKPFVMNALKLVRRRDPDLPFIVLMDAPEVNEDAHEDVLTECLLLGATDCLDKTHPSMLPVAVAFAVEQRVLTVQRDRIERELEHSRTRYEARSVMANPGRQHISEVDRG